jgi:dienelactone hydrolase
MIELANSPRMPDDALDAITRWVGDSMSRERSADVDEMTARRSQLVQKSGYQERAVRFGPDERLFGILDVPNDAEPKAPAIIFLNTGSEYRVGPHRLYVPLARHWAAQGHLVLRYDLGGLGDSDAPPGAVHNDEYPAHAIDDVRKATAFVRKQAPGRRVIVAGLCSGGWHALAAAREGLVDAFVAINAPLELYRGDGVPSAKAWIENQQTENYRTALSDAARWKRALLRRSAYRRLLRFLWSRVKDRLRDVLGRRVDPLAGDLLRVSAKGITGLFVFSRGERGLESFRLHTRATLRRRSAKEHIRHVVVDGSDHTFSSRAAQQKLREILVDFAASQTSESPTRRG